MAPKQLHLRLLRGAGIFFFFFLTELSFNFCDTLSKQTSRFLTQELSGGSLLPTTWQGRREISSDSHGLFHQLLDVSINLCMFSCISYYFSQQTGCSSLILIVILLSHTDTLLSFFLSSYSLQSFLLPCFRPHTNFSLHYPIAVP